MSRPLDDVKILDLTRLLPGGFCTLLLADLGADVIKVEDTGQGDYVRWAPPYYGSEEHTPLGTRSAIYLSLNRNKRSVRLDLKQEGGRQALLKLVESADVLVESSRPGGRGRWPADPVRRADRRSRRRRADGRRRDPRRAAGRAPERPGPDGRHLDDRWLARVAGDGGWPLLRLRGGAGARQHHAERGNHLLPALRGSGRLDHLRRAGAEVLGPLLQGRRPRRPDREAIREAGLGGPWPGRGDLQDEDPGRMEGLQR